MPTLCPFCTQSEIHKRIIVENDSCYAFPTNIPIVPGHVLIAPKRCVKTFYDLSEQEKSAIFQLLEQLSKALTKAFGSEGFNYAWNEGAAAGQSIPHFHLHVLPRKAEDTGITEYEPRKFLYRPGSRAETPLEELMQMSKIIKENL